ncbi:hypothetical protein ACH32B_11480 [Enterobacter dykesii]
MTFTAPVAFNEDEIVPPDFPSTELRRESSPAATVPAAAPTSLIALFPKPTFIHLDRQ